MKKEIYFIIALSIASFPVNAGNGLAVITSGHFRTINNTTIAMQVNAVAVNNIGEISWKAVTQINVRRYELEKSNDGQNFNYVTAVAGNIAITNLDYIAEDRNLLNGINYYRIKLIDNKGGIIYSPVTLLNTKAISSEIKILPTVVNDKLHIWMPSNTAINSVEITDAAGRKLIRNWHISNTSNLADIEMRKLSPGFYSVKLTTNKGEIITHKFMKK